MYCLFEARYMLPAIKVITSPCLFGRQRRQQQLTWMPSIRCLRDSPRSLTPLPPQNSFVLMT